MIFNTDSKENFLNESQVILSNSISSITIYDTKGNTCEYCISNNEIVHVDCHFICANCYKDKCPICNSNPNVLIYCQNCSKPCDRVNLTCEHQVCTACCISGCELCRIFDLVNSNKCEKCKKLFNYESFCRLHCFCQDCYSGDCPLCPKSQRNPELCTACNKYIANYYCEQRHALCSICYKDCILCFKGNNIRRRRRSSGRSSVVYNSIEKSETWDYVSVESIQMNSRLSSLIQISNNGGNSSVEETSKCCKNCEIL